MALTEKELAQRILQFAVSVSPQAVNKFNLIGRQATLGDLERSIGITFDFEERALAYRTFDALKNGGYLIPTYTDLVDPENWVVISELGKQALEGVNLRPAATPRVGGVSDLITVPKIFLSHASSDAIIAGHLKVEIERCLPGVQVFRSTDPTDLPPGSRWPKEIQDALESAASLILIATGRGLQRPWVWFECGTFWFKGRNLMPLCFGEIRKGTLPPPYWECQALDAFTEDDLKALFETLSKITGTALAGCDYLELARSLSELESKAAAQLTRVTPGWLGAEWDESFLAYRGPKLQDLPLIEDEIFRQSMTHALESAGFQARLANQQFLLQFGDRGWKQIYLTNRTTWRRKVVLGDVILAAVPRPALPR